MAQIRTVELYWPNQHLSIMLRVSYNTINNVVPLKHGFDCFDTDGSPVELADDACSVDVDWGKSLVLGGLGGIRNLGASPEPGTLNAQLLEAIQLNLPTVIQAASACGWDHTSMIQCDIEHRRIKLLPIHHSYVTLKYAGSKGRGDKQQSVLYEIPCRVYYSHHGNLVQIADFSFVRPNKHSNRYKLKPFELGYLEKGYQKALEEGIPLDHFDFHVDQNQVQAGMTKSGIVERKSRTDVEAVARNQASQIKAQMFSVFPTESLDTNELSQIRTPAFFMLSKRVPKRYVDSRSCTRRIGNLKVTIYMTKVEIPMRGADRKEILDDEGNKVMRTIHDGFPGISEMRVFDALLYIAARRGRRMSVENEHVKLVFTIGQIEDYLQARGITYDQSTIRDALQVLWRSPVTVEDPKGEQAPYDGTFIMSFRRAEGENDLSAWAFEAMLHKYFSWGILELQYRPVTLLQGAMPKSIFVEHAFRWLWIRYNNAHVGQLITLNVNEEFDALHLSADIRSKRKQAEELKDRLIAGHYAKEDKVELIEVKEGRSINIYLEWQVSSSFVSNLKAIQQQTREHIESLV